MPWNETIALVTGGASGIGRALTTELIHRGARVVVADVNAAAAGELARSLGERASSVRLDVRDAAAFHSVIADAVLQFGRMDLLVNNAGIGVAGDAHRFHLEHWQRVLDINLHGVIHGIQAVYPRMVAQGSGQIVNVASLAGLGPAPFLLPYATSKAAVVGLSRTLRIEAAAHGVKVNVVCPSAIDTPLLDALNPGDLPDVGWVPDIRRYLTSMSGAPYPADRFARETLDAVERNEAVIVIPGKARLAWRLGRFLPNFIDGVTAGKARRERSAATKPYA